MNIPDLIILILLGVLSACALLFIRRRKKRGCNGCCAGCAHQNGCDRKEGPKA